LRVSGNYRRPSVRRCGKQLSDAHVSESTPSLRRQEPVLIGHRHGGPIRAPHLEQLRHALEERRTISACSHQSVWCPRLHGDRLTASREDIDADMFAGLRQVNPRPWRHAASPGEKQGVGGGGFGDGELFGPGRAPPRPRVWWRHVGGDLTADGGGSGHLWNTGADQVGDLIP